MIIKTYDEKYLTKIILMIRECIIEINKKDYSKKQLSAWSDINLTDFKKSVHRIDQIVLTNKKKLIGYGDMDNSGYLDKLFVHKEYQHKGVAKLLLKELELNCSSKFIFYIFLHNCETIF